jgi:hypothetical protein
MNRIIQSITNGRQRADVFIIALQAGAIAIIANTSILAIADSFGLVTARGGLLRLLIRWLVPRVIDSGHPAVATRLQNIASEYIFQSGFHLLVGLVMAVLLVQCAHKRLETHAWSIGAAAALIVWLMNASVILPALGEGFAGEKSLTVVGIVYFALAHTVFFLIIALDTRRRLRQSRDRAAT